MLEDFVLDTGEEGLSEDLVDDNVLPRLRGVVLLGESLYTALAEEASSKVRGWIGDVGHAGLEVCRVNFLALCWPGIVDERLRAIPCHHLLSWSCRGCLGSGWALGWTGNKARLSSFGFRAKQSTTTSIGTERATGAQALSLGAAVDPVLPYGLV